MKPNLSADQEMGDASITEPLPLLVQGFEIGEFNAHLSSDKKAFYKRPHSGETEPAKKIRRLSEPLGYSLSSLLSTYGILGRPATIIEQKGMEPEESLVKKIGLNGFR